MREVQIRTWVVVSCAGILAVAGSVSAQTVAMVAGDFNGDGIDDLAIPVPNEDVGTVIDAGAVQIIYGTTTGLNGSGSQIWNQNKSGVAGDAETSEQFGSTLAAGDFNNDGFDDLAAAVPRQGVGSIANAGAVHVFFGSATGLKGSGSQYWNQNTTSVLNASKAGDMFGSALMAGDFDGDGFADLAIGSPGDKVSTLPGAGGVNVLFGSATGLSAVRDQYFTQDTDGILGAAAAGDAFGSVLAVGDFDNDGFADLAVYALETINGFNDAGGVSIIYGSPVGLAVAGNQLWSQDSVGIEDDAEASDNFGSAMSAGDFNGDGFDDLAIGAAEDSVGLVNSAGTVNVLYGAVGGLSDFLNQSWNQDSGTVLDAAETGDAFGSALAAGDFNKDGYADLAVGAPGENVVTGAVHVLYGSDFGLTDIGNQVWTQDSAGIVDTAEAIDAFGYVLCVGKFDKGGKRDLAIGIPFEDIDGIDNCGAVAVIYGSSTGLVSANNQLWHQNSPGIKDECEISEFFGGL